MHKVDKLLDLATNIQVWIERVIEFTGRLVSWLVLVLVILVSYDVTMRYVFNQGSIAIQELEWHLFALIFLLGAAYTLKHDDHVRLDLWYQSRYSSDRIRALINLLGALVMLMPFCWLIMNSSSFFVQQAWLIKEGSPDPGGLPYRWLLKAAIPLGFLLLFLQGVAEFIRNLLRLRGRAS